MATIKVCLTCDKPIEGVMIIHATPTVVDPRSGEKKTLSFAFHNECFVCVTCKKELAKIPYGYYEGGFYCGEDLYAVHGRTCATCKKLITGVSIAVGNKTWCKEHFKCFKCSVLIESSTHREHKGKPICDDCYGQITSYVCKKCKSSIDHRDLVESMGHQFHTDCLVCCVGDHKIDDQEPYYEHKDLKIYCQTHFDQVDKGEKCAKCRKTLDTEYVKLGDKSYHAACWTCTKCNIVIESRTAVQIQGGFYCVPCAKVDTKIHSADPTRQGTGVMAKRLLPGYGDAESAPGVVPPNQSKKYPYKTLQQRPPQLPREIDLRQKEQYLSPDDFKEVFDVSKEEFNSFPLWKKLWMKKEKNLF